MFIHRQDLLEKFDESFALEERQHFFAPSQTEWMLPITEAEVNRAVAQFRLLSGLAMAATWLLLFGALAFFFSRHRTIVAWDMLTIALMAIAPFFLHAFAFSIPQKPFVKRLRRLVQENDPILVSLLVRKRADVEAN